MLRRVIQKALKALPKPPYADASYWDKVYSETFQSQGAIEWGVPPALLFNYQWISENGAVRDAKLEDHASKDADVLVVGCGNSRLSEDMVKAGWDPAKIVSVDFSATSIEQAAARARDSGDERVASLRYCVADCRALHQVFAASSFDCCVDKGLLDGLYCSSAASEAIPATARSAIRILRPGGRYVSVLSGGVLGLAPPTHLQDYMADDRWASVQVIQLLPKIDGLYLWIWTKAKALAAAPTGAQRIT